MYVHKGFENVHILIDGSKCPPTSMTINRQSVEIDYSQTIRHHSEAFSWGYNGSGPSQTALCILLHVLKSENMAIKYYTKFREDIIAKVPNEIPYFNIRIDVDDWLRCVVEKGHPRLPSIYFYGEA